MDNYEGVESGALAGGGRAPDSLGAATTCVAMVCAMLPCGPSGATAGAGDGVDPGSGGRGVGQYEAASVALAFEYIISTYYYMKIGDAHRWDFKL